MFKTAAIFFFAFMACTVLGQNSSTGRDVRVAAQSWIAQSDRYTDAARYRQEVFAGGVAPGSGRVRRTTAVPTVANELAERKEAEEVLAKLEAAQRAEPNKNVAEDLAILITSTQHQFRQRHLPSADYRGVMHVLKRD